jgi:hypothetical protein
MSLDVNWSKLHPAVVFSLNKETNEKEFAPMFSGLMWSTITVELSEITEKNIGEWVWRLNFLLRWLPSCAVAQKIFEPGDPNYYFTEQDLRPYVGLSTNSHRSTRKQFLVRTMAILERIHQREEFAAGRKG